MNFYEHHLGDYMRDTAHLSMLEDAAYRRLLDVYYTSEKPLPADLKQCCRLVRANSTAERKAVAQVLQEFFTLTEDGHHQSRADEEIAAYHAKEPERDARRAAERDRQQRSRNRRKELFEQLRLAGIVPAFDASTHELEATLSRVTVTQRHAGVTRDNTATQSPVPSPQSPPSPDLPSPQASGLSARILPAELRAISPAAEACIALKAAGVVGVTPSFPPLLDAMAEGVTPAELADCATEFPGKKLAYLVAVARGRRAEPAIARINGKTPPPREKPGVWPPPPTAEDLADAQH